MKNIIDQPIMYFWSSFSIQSVKKMRCVEAIMMNISFIISVLWACYPRSGLKYPTYDKVI